MNSYEEFYPPLLLFSIKIAAKCIIATCARTYSVLVVRFIHFVRNATNGIAMNARIHFYARLAKVSFVLIVIQEFTARCVVTHRVLRATKSICIHAVYAQIPSAITANFLQDVRNVMIVSAMNARTRYTANFAIRNFVIIAMTESNVLFAEREDVPTAARILVAWNVRYIPNIARLARFTLKIGV